MAEHQGTHGGNTRRGEGGRQTDIWTDKILQYKKQKEENKQIKYFTGDILNLFRKIFIHCIPYLIPFTVIHVIKDHLL